MFTTSYLKRLLFFDIETCGKYKDYADFYTNDPDGCKIFENKMIRINSGRYEDHIQAYAGQVSLFPEFGQIACLSYGVWKDGEMTISTIKNEGNELDMMKKIYMLFVKASANNLIPCGWNIKNFDVPWVVRKCLTNGLEVPSCLSTYEKKPWEVAVLDLKEVWKSNSSLDVTFEDAVYAMGLPTPKDDIDGSQVHDVYHNFNGGLDRIVTYCEKDVKAMILFAEKLHNIYGKAVIAKI